jgi:hypothetical protein
MTRRFRLPFPRRLVMIATLAGGALALVLGTTAAASAAPLNHSHLRPEFFTVSINEHGSQVDAYGPVHGYGTDQTLSPRVDVFDLHHPAGHVVVLHTKIANPVVNWADCTATLSEHGTWAFVNGTGADRHASGFGQFWLSENEQLARDHYGHCEVNKPPKTLEVDVFGIGQARN